MRNISFLAILILFASCSAPKWVITHETSKKIPIDHSTEAIADKSYEAFLQPYKARIDKEMDRVIGRTDETMTAHGPESLLSNWSADVYLETASNYLHKPVDMAVVNLGGLRTVIPAGNITVKKVFELMPFENELDILWINGHDLNDLLQFFAKIGGQGVAGIHMKIKNGKAVDITIDGKPLDLNKSYSIATNNYLAGGNDQMYPLEKYTKRVNTGIKVRDMLMKYIEKQTKEGKIIHPVLDGRISIAK